MDLIITEDIIRIHVRGPRKIITLVGALKKIDECLSKRSRSNQQRPHNTASTLNSIDLIKHLYPQSQKRAMDR